jgi:hypothetical protein
VEIADQIRWSQNSKNRKVFRKLQVNCNNDELYSELFYYWQSIGENFSAAKKVQIKKILLSQVGLAKLMNFINN